MGFSKYEKCPNCKDKTDPEKPDVTLGFDFKRRVEFSGEKVARYKCGNCGFTAHYEKPEDVPDDWVDKNLSIK